MSRNSSVPGVRRCLSTHNGVRTWGGPMPSTVPAAVRPRLIRRSVVMALVALTAAIVLPVAAPADSWRPGPALFGTGATLNVPVEMDDGTVLRADVHFPTDPDTGAASPGPFPVILTQTPYGKSGGSAASSSGATQSLSRRAGLHPCRGRRAGDGRLGRHLRALRPGAGRRRRGPRALGRRSSRAPTATSGSSACPTSASTSSSPPPPIGPDSPLKAIFPMVAGNDLYRDAVLRRRHPQRASSAPAGWP